MGKLIKYKKLFVYSSKSNKFFCTDFDDGINLVYGKNTSGKSTLIQAILYTFGINDGKYKLKELLNEEVIFRVDFLIIDKISENVTIIRDNNFLVIKRENQPILKFTGIGGDNSYEHTFLKYYLSKLFGFSLYLQSSGIYKPASIESMFLPYYIAQDVGWVSRHKSFRNLEFIKNFKIDFFDYYLGITNEYDREEKQQLEEKKKLLNNEITFLKETEIKNLEIQLVKLNDEKFINKSDKYLNIFNQNREQLIQLEKKYLDLCNKLTFQRQQYSLLSKIKRALSKQNPHIDKCPTCIQPLPCTLGNIYEYHQNKNDTYNQLIKLRSNIENLQSQINSTEKAMNVLKDTIARDYHVLSSYREDKISFEDWLNNKANVKLWENISKSINQKSTELEKITKALSNFKTDEEIEEERNFKSYKFRNIFKGYMNDLSIKEFDDEICYSLYKMPTFPKQGVELLKTILAYNFAFVNIISKTQYVHKLPLLLDAIFKEDIEEDNRKSILKFIYKNKNINQQMIITISDSKNNQVKVKDYNDKFLNNEAKLICINEENERAFLSEYRNEYSNYLEETFNFME